MMPLLHVIFLLIFAGATISAQDRDMLCSKLPESETLHYKAIYDAGIFRIYGGDVTFKVRHENQHRVILESTGKTRPTYTWLYRVDDFYRVDFDCRRNYPLFFEQHTLEGSHERHWAYNFFPDQKYIEINNKMTGSSRVVNYSPLPVDILTAVYITRFLPLQRWPEGHEYSLQTLINDSLQILKITYQGIRDIRMERRTERVFVVSTVIPGGTLFRKDKALRVYLTTDFRRLPLWVEAPVAIGKVRAVLYVSEQP